MSILVDKGLEKALLEIAQEDHKLSSQQEARLNWLKDKKMVFRSGSYERGITEQEWVASINDSY